VFDRIQADLAEQEFYNNPSNYYFYKAERMFTSFSLESYGTIIFLIFFVSIVLISTLTFAFGQYETHFGPEKYSNNDFKSASKLELSGEVTDIRFNLGNMMMVLGVMVTFVQYGGLLALGSKVVRATSQTHFLDQQSRNLFPAHFGNSDPIGTHYYQCRNAHLGRWHSVYLCRVPITRQEAPAENDQVPESHHLASVLPGELLNSVFDPRL
jgi:hypothetical protein